MEVALKAKPKSQGRSAYDLSHVKGVAAYVVIHNSAPCGRIVANFSDNPNGSVCTATVSIWGGALANMPITTGTAGGCGYDKLSAAVAAALGKVLKDAPSEMSGRGKSAIDNWFSSLGYELFEVL